MEDYAVEPVALADRLSDPVSCPGVEALGVLDVELQQRSRLRQPGDDAGDQLHPVIAGADDLRAGFLRHPGDVESDRGVGDDPVTRMRLPSRKPAMEVLSSFAGRLSRAAGQWPMPIPPSTGITAPAM